MRSLGPSLLVVAALAAIATGRALGNGFAFDDVPMIVENAQVHDLAAPWVYAQQSYWPPKNLGYAYRPWTVWWLALQWAAGNGAAWIFHATSLVLAVLLAVAVFLLARQILPPAAAFAGAALFAVHPVHVEATANVVGQAELWMSLFVTAAALLYLRARRVGTPSAGARWLLMALLILAAASKEQGIVLPGLLAALELTGLTNRQESLSARLGSSAPTLRLLTLTAVAFFLARALVVHGLSGGPPARGLEGLGLGGRALVVLPLVREWVRLLIWPRQLVAQYTPPAYGGPPAWDGAAVAGLALVAGIGALAVLARRRAPAVSAGILWIAIGLAPVSNLFFPTGILVAERTLLLPSVGLALVAGAAIGAATDRTRPSGRLAPLAWTGLATLVVAGAARSWSRQAVWRDNRTLFTQTVIDEPRSYRSWQMLARQRQGENDLEGAKLALERAGALYGGDRRVFEDWGQILRRQGRCDLAIGVLERGVAAEPRETISRSRLFECLMTLGRYDEARRVAQAGIRLGATEFEKSEQRAAERARPAMAEPGPAAVRPAQAASPD